MNNDIINIIKNDIRFIKGNFIKDEKNKLIFYIHQKSGCTSFLKMIFQNLGILDLALSYDKYRAQPIQKNNGWPHYYRYQVYQFENKILPNDLISGEYKLIKLVRNPYSRIVSSYLHILKVNKSLLKDYCDINNDLSFYDFLNLIKNNNILNIDLHLDTQICDFEKNNLLKFDDIIKLEELNDSIIYLNNKYNINLEYIHEKIHKTKTNYLNKQMCGYIKYNILKDNIPSYKNFYDDNNIKKIVDKLFYDDIQYYNYDFFNNNFISIGPNCNTSGLLQYLNTNINNSIRNISYPFDWINSNLNMIYNCFDNNFNDFLNIDYIYIENNVEIHSKYKDDNRTNIYVHNSILKNKNYYERCVDRLNKNKENNITFIYSLSSSNILNFDDDNEYNYGNLKPNIFSLKIIDNINSIIKEKFKFSNILIINYIYNSTNYEYNKITKNNISILNVNIKENIVNGDLWKNIHNIILYL
jgi:hypothetical protein